MNRAFTLDRCQVLTRQMLPQPLSVPRDINLKDPPPIRVEMLPSSFNNSLPFLFVNLQLLLWRQHRIPHHNDIQQRPWRNPMYKMYGLVLRHKVKRLQTNLVLPRRAGGVTPLFGLEPIFEGVFDP